MLFCYQSIYVCFLGHIETFFGIHQIVMRLVTSIDQVGEGSSPVVPVLRAVQTLNVIPSGSPETQ